MFDLIKHFGKALNYINISNIGHHASHHIQSSSELIKLGSIILQGLGQILPSKLEGFKLQLSFTVSDFEVFLRNSKNTFIIRLLISNEMQVESEDNFLPYIEEYIVKKKKVKYIAFMIVDFIGKYRDLSSLKNEVKKIWKKQPDDVRNFFSKRHKNKNPGYKYRHESRSRKNNKRY